MGLLAGKIRWVEEESALTLHCENQSALATAHSREYAAAWDTFLAPQTRVKDFPDSFA